MVLSLLIDSADPKSWKELWSLGLFQGITTNPSLLKRAGVPCTLEALADLAKEAWALGCPELHLQSWGFTAEELLGCSRALLALAPARVVVKLPFTEGGLQAAGSLLEQGARVTLTACYGAPQVLAAAALGCTYVAPYLGRIHDEGRDSFAEVLRMQQCLVGLGSTTRLLVASLRSPEDLSRLAPSGISTFTLSPALARQLWRHPATEAAAVQFQADATWHKNGPPPH